jgi:MoaA/NifB/PqqE/SkfB family radical SAM enzyme
MSKNFTAINLTEKMFTVTWDLGRRCNYDCTYCPPHRHNNTSAHDSAENLFKTYDFIYDYLNIIKQYQKNMGVFKINVTGGEPMANPHTIDLFEYIHQKDPTARVSVTTNGAYGRKIATRMADALNAITISYHTEADPITKKIVQDNLFFVHNYVKEKRGKGNVTVNVMMHKKREYWDECIDLMNRLDAAGIPYVPRPIGEHNNDWSIKKGYTHVYEPDQLEWIQNYWKSKNTPPEEEFVSNTTSSNEISLDEMKRLLKASTSSKNILGMMAVEKPKTEQTARSQGRMCCGSRPMQALVDNKWEDIKFIPNTEFEDWYCLIDRYWLHIEQEMGRVYHHQTCQANFGKQRGPIGYLNDTNTILMGLEARLSNPHPELIVCPNKVCNCGLCIPKALDEEFLRKNLLANIQKLHE